jgi:hypothetical protein
VGSAGGGQDDSELSRMLRGGALDVKARRACRALLALLPADQCKWACQPAHD